MEASESLSCSHCAERRTSTGHLSHPQGMYRFAGRRDGWIEASEERQLPAIVAPVRTLIDQSRKPPAGPAERSKGRRSLAFALLSAPHPLLVDDGIASLSTVPNLANSLTDLEVGIITSTLHAPSVPVGERRKLIGEIADLSLRRLIPALRDLEEPDLQESAWAALRRMNAPISEDDLRKRLAAESPETRIAATRELLAREPETAIPLIADTALRDRDADVRLGAIEALGETESQSAAIVPLEGVFAGDDPTERQAAARALRQIGGEASADALHRLAFTGSPESQRYAVFVLLSMQVGMDDPRVRDIASRHQDAKINELLSDHGIELGHSH